MKFSSFLNFNSFAFEGVAFAYLAIPCANEFSGKKAAVVLGPKSESIPLWQSAIERVWQSLRFTTKAQDLGAHKFANKRPEQSKQNAHGQKRPGAAGGAGAGLLAHLNIDMIPILFTNIIEGVEGVEWSGEEAGG